jgi:hypothetical protein
MVVERPYCDQLRRPPGRSGRVPALQGIQAQGVASVDSVWIGKTIGLCQYSHCVGDLRRSVRQTLRF